jgi:YesN/AraC family two-component response regulator
MAIRIFIYDDSKEHIDSLKALFMLNERIICVGEAFNCKNVLADIDNYYPDIVMMDINMPEVDGMQGYF